MKRLIKFLFYLVGLVILLVIAAIIVVPMYVDPNDFKGEIAQKVEDKTGRSLDMQGDIRLSVFPWLGLELGKTQLGNAPGFDNPIFASVDAVQVRVKLLPLLKKKLEMDTLTLHGLQVNLARDPKGRGNWEDLAQGKSEPDEAAPEARETGAPPVAGLAIGGVDISDATVDWDDRQSGQHYRVDKISLHTGAIELGRPVQLELGLHLAGGDPAMDGTARLQGELELDPASQRYRVRGLSLNGQAKGEGLPGGTVTLALRADLDADLEAQTARLTGLQVDTLGMQLSGTASAERLLEAPTYSASITLAELNPRAVMERLGQPPLETRDPGVLAKASAKARLAGTAKRLSIESLSARLDDTNLEGRIDLPSLAGPSVRFELNVDAIDVDRYLPPPAEAEAASPAASTPGEAAAGAGAQLPMDTLRALDVDGRFSLGRLKVSNLSLTDIGLRLIAKDGLIRIDPIAAQLYEGAYNGHVRLDARGQQPRISVDEKLSGVQAGPLLKDLVGKDQLTGTARLSAKLRMVGGDPEQVRKTLNGDVSFAFLEGAIKGVNVAHLLREAQARLKGQSLPPEQGEVQTDFSELKGSVHLTNGLAQNDDLMLKSPLLRVEGKGQANLVTEEVDYLLTTVLVGTLEGQGGAEVEKLQGVAIPIRVGGTFDQLTYRPELSGALKAKAKQKIDEKKKELEAKAAEKLKKKLGEKGKDLLKGLGGFLK